jgi:NADPH:quinone reductase-like Zn-dependent oxidoreductase
MKAALITRYGSPDVIRIAEVAKPTPEPGEVLIRVYATSVNRTDSGELAPFLLLRLAFGIWKPRRSIFGMDVAGVVEQAGAGVTRFRVGDRVFGMCPSRRNGAQAEYVCLPETGPITTLPPSIAFEQAVVCEGAFYASATMTELTVGPGTHILIYGASGAIGSAAVQLAKDRGAEVTAAVEARHLDLARSARITLSIVRAASSPDLGAASTSPIVTWKPGKRPASSSSWSREITVAPKTLGSQDHLANVFACLEIAMRFTGAIEGKSFVDVRPHPAGGDALQ